MAATVTDTSDAVGRRLRAMTPEARVAFAATLTPEERVLLAYEWDVWARDSQCEPPGDWVVWVMVGGRGAGKSRTGAETVRRWICAGAPHVALIGKTPADVRDVMIQNPLKSGLLDIFPPHQRPQYFPTRSQVVFHTGAVAHVYSGEAPETLRGPAHSHFWADELPTWQYPTEAYNNLMLGLRVGVHPRGIITTTPKPMSLLRRILRDKATVTTHATTHENEANLSPSFLREVLAQYAGTRLERQEIYGELLEDVEGALWRYDLFRDVPTAPPLAQIVVAIDPAATATDASDETGIIVAGRDERDVGYVLADYSGRYSPDGWANKAIDAYELHQANRIVCETNNGGDMVTHTVRTAARARGLDVPIQRVTASRGKYTRAEPVAMLYEQGRILHVGARGAFAKLEEQLCSWAPNTNQPSPDRLDALVWACTVLLVLRRGAMASPEAPEAVTDTPDAAAEVVLDRIRREGLYWPGGVA